MPADSMPDRDAFGHWLSGFTDGEGCFSLEVNRSKKHPQPMVRFAIRLRNDDRAILEDARAYLGCGRLYLDETCSADSPNRKPRCLLTVTSTEHCAEIIVPHFDKYPLRAKKRRDFVIWKEAVALCWGIHQRRRKVRSSGGGTFPKWAPEEFARFIQMTVALKAQRVYQSEQVHLPPKKAPAPDRTLFDGLPDDRPAP